jgi:hypothetical protein
MQSHKDVGLLLVSRNPGLDCVPVPFGTIVVIVGMGKRKAGYRDCLFSFQLDLENTRQSFEKTNAVAKSKI